MNYERLRILQSKFPKAALELDLVSGKRNPETGEVNSDFEPDDMQDLMEYCVLEVLDLIAEQGHSGFSHGYFTNLLIPLLKDEPITPLTGKDWEWDEPRFMSDKQNKRCSKVFLRPNGTAYNIEGFAFSDDGGKTYWTNNKSFKDITFPCSNKDLKTQCIVLDSEESELDGQISIDI